MPVKMARRALTIILFSALFAYAAADVIQSAKDTSSHTFDTIKDKISIEAEDVQTLLRLAAQKQADAQKDRSFITKIFAILFPSSKPAVNALLATAYISGPPNFLLALCPPNIDPSSLSIMVAFAVGGLLGDTFFHLLPEIFLGEDGSDAKVRMVFLEPNRNLLLGVFIFIGLATFMAMDKTLRIATGGAHSHSHSNEPDLHTQARKIDEDDYRILGEDLQKIASQEGPEEQQERLRKKPYNDAIVNGVKTKDIVANLAATNQGIRKRKSTSSSAASKAPSSPSPVSPSLSEKASLEPEADLKPSADADAAAHTHTPNNPSVKLAGLLNLLADFTHNITDGLALSTSFYSSPTLGATTTMAVFFHEIPHEVGDFALLIQSGFSKRAAMGAQFVTALGAFLGTVIGILVQEYGSGESSAGTGASVGALAAKPGLLGTSLQWSDTLLPFTAGTFLYVGTVGVIPELLENEQGSTTMQEVKRMVMQFGAMAVGALIMVAISWS